MSIFNRKKPLLPITGPVAPKFKVSDLVNYKPIDGANAQKYMAIIDFLLIL